MWMTPNMSYVLSIKLSVRKIASFLWKLLLFLCLNSGQRKQNWIDNSLFIKLAT